MDAQTEHEDRLLSAAEREMVAQTRPPEVSQMSRVELQALAACRTEVYSMIANDSFVGANVHRTRDRAQSALLRSPIELASRCLGCI